MCACVCFSQVEAQKVMVKAVGDFESFLYSLFLKNSKAKRDKITNDHKDFYHLNSKEF